MLITKYKKQKGLTLLESLIALVVAAVGILGVLGLQLRTLADTKNSVTRAQAIHLIQDLGERMKVNPNALANIDNYVGTWVTAATADPARDCAALTCDNAQLAIYDIGKWRQTVEKLPMGNASIFKAKGETIDSNRRQLGVMISWRENERGGATNDFKDYADATKSAQISGTTTTFSNLGGDVTCPSGYACHVQYIPVSARCAPFLTNSVARYFCAGS